MLYESEYYGIIDSNSPHLMHHGIKGQKWGVRRFQNEDGSLTPAGKSRLNWAQRRSKKGVGSAALTRYFIRSGSSVRQLHTYIEGVKDAKGVGDKISSVVGSKALEGHARNAQFTQKELAAASRTRLGKHLHNVRADNAGYAAEYHKNRHEMSLAQRGIEAYLGMNTTYASTPYRRLSGRTTTHGMDILDKMFTGGLAGLTMDAVYLSNQRKANKAASSSSTSTKTKAPAKKQSPKLPKMSKNAKRAALGAAAGAAAVGIAKYAKYKAGDTGWRVLADGTLVKIK